MKKEIRLEGKSEEEVLMQANELLLKGQAFCIFTVDNDGNAEAICSVSKLNYLERLGLFSFIGSNAAERIRKYDSE